VLAEPAVALMGGAGRTGEEAVTYLRISAAGSLFALVALAGQGYLRGISDLRRPLVIVVAANAANVVLEVVFVYGLHWGLAGSAWGTVLAQAGMGLAFVRELLRAPAADRRPRAALMRPPWCSTTLCRACSATTRRCSREIWLLFAVMQPANAVVFALDGILIGAGDTRFLMWSMLAAGLVYVPVALLALALDWGIVGVWWGFLGLIVVRLATNVARFAGRRWAVTGAVHTPAGA
jgi:Na+-driven multidrug efflux pump